MKSFNFVTSFLALAIVLGCTATTQAAPLDLETKITSDDASADDWFGRSVAISGNTAIVGADRDVDAGIFSGSAYLFNATTGSQLAKLTADDAAEGDFFGSSVAISGNTAIVGAVGDDDDGGGGDNSGSAYLFDLTTGNQIKLTADDAATFDGFGVSVAISGNTAIVGAWFDDDGGSNSGSAYLFNATTGSQIAKLTATDAAAGDVFGFSVAISGNTAIVGAFRDDDGANSSGSAYLFDLTTGNQIKLTADDAAADDLFGSSVAISGNTAIVGAVRNDDGSNNSGSAYLFDVATGNQLAKLTATDAAEDDEFGRSVAISGDTAIVGAWLDEGTNPGSAYLFDVPTGDQLAKFRSGDVASGDQFGVSVAISGNTAIVGAWLDDDGGSNSGSAYLFENIPEPSTLLLGTMAAVGLLMRRIRAR